MKISAWHKKQGDVVEWYNPETTELYDKVYESKVFSFTKDYPEDVKAAEVIQGGSGYCIHLEDGKEVFDKSKNINLPYEVEHIYPDYGLYGIEDTAYGFMSRGCPRGCGFCHVAPKEGKCAYKVADLSEFWDGQKFIKLMDPNTLACREWKDILQQLADSKAYVDFTQGVDIRLMTPEKAKMFADIRTKMIHFAFDRYQDWDIVTKNLQIFKDNTGWERHRVSVYVLVNFDTTLEQDLARVEFLRSLEFQPYVMIYDKEHLPKHHILRSLKQWCNPVVFWRCETLDDYLDWYQSQRKKGRRNNEALN